MVAAVAMVMAMAMAMVVAMAVREAWSLRAEDYATDKSEHACAVGGGDGDGDGCGACLPLSPLHCQR